jgi:CheY-like chemotaxis protein
MGCKSKASKMETNAKANALIMLVDDHPSILEVLKIVLEYEGFKTVTCGQSTKVLGMIEQYHPNLLLLDVMMPTPDGWAILRALRKSEATATLPVILMTAGSLYQFNIPPDIDIKQSPTKMLSKPFDNNVLINLVADMLRE